MDERESQSADRKRARDASVATPSALLDPATLDPAEECAGPQRRRLVSDGDGLTSDGRLRSGKLAGLSLSGAIVALSWPVLTESLLNSLVGLTDTVLAAGLDDGGAAADAVAAASYGLWFVGLVVAAIGVGATALVSRATGAGRRAVADAAVGQTMLLALACGLLVGCSVALLASPLSRLLHLPPATADAFCWYLWICSTGVVTNSVLFGGIACSRGAGDSFRPLLVMMLVNAVNMTVSWALSGVDLKWSSIEGGRVVSHVLVHNGLGINLGVKGIALGTVIAEVVGAIVMLTMLARGSTGVTLRARRLKPHWHTLARLFRVGWPNFLETLGMWAGNFAIIIMIGWLNATSPGLLGAHLVAIRIESFSYLPGFEFGAAAATLAGQYLGAGAPELARKAVWRCAWGASAFMGVMGAVFMLAPQAIVGLISSQPQHLEQTPKALFITGMIQIPFALSMVFRQALRGSGDVKAAMWISWITTYGMRLPLAYALTGTRIPLPSWLGGGELANPFPETWSHSLGGPLAAVWVALCSELVIRAAMFTGRFMQGYWARSRV